jgi:sigma-E factor negative regulatory protein RseC
MLYEPLLFVHHGGDDEYMEQKSEILPPSSESSRRGECSEQTGRVLALDGDYALVQVEQGGCGRCHEPGGCGGPQLTRIFGRASRQCRARNACGARPGDRVVIVLPAGVLARHATLGYGLPLAGLLAGAMIGEFLGKGNGGALAGAALGLLLVWRMLRWRSLRIAEDPQSGAYVCRIQP